MQEIADETVVDALLAASRAMVALAVRSLSAVSHDVTMTQFRALIVLASRGPQTLAALAEELAVGASTASRLCDRLVRADLITRDPDPTDRRRISLILTPQGRSLIDAVTAARRAEITRVLGTLPATTQARLTAGLHEFAAAAGEVPEQQWSAGWDI